MGKVLAVSDIHGYGGVLEGLLDRAQYNGAEDKLFLLGDYVNKGPDSRGTLELVRSLCDGGATALLGNNERKWLGLTSGGRRLEEANSGDLLAFLEELPLWAEYGSYIFVHAGLRTGVPLAAQTAEDLTEIRHEFHDAAAEAGRIVVFGHTATFRFGVRPEELWFGAGKIGIDTGAGHGKFLSLVDLSEGLQYVAPVSSPQEIKTVPLPLLGCRPELL